MSAAAWVGVAIGVVLAIFLYFLPTYFAFKREHEYKWIIFAINVVFGASGLGWVGALIWAIYPKDKSLADPVLGNPTGTGARNVGHTIGDIQASAAEVRAARNPGAQSASALESLDRLGALAQKGIITPDEFAKKKAALLANV